MERQGTGRTRGDLDLAPLDPGPERGPLRVRQGEAHVVVRHLHAHLPVAGKTQVVGEGALLLREHRVQTQDVVVGGQAAVAPGEEVEGARHGAQVDPLGGGTALDVLGVRLQGLAEELPRRLAVDPRQDPGVHHRAEGGPVRGARQVVLHGAGDEVGIYGDAEPSEDVGDLFGRQEEEQHEDVGLLGGLVPVDAVALGLEDPVQTAGSAAGLPVEFGQSLVAGELGDHPLVEGDAKLTGDGLEPFDLVRAQSDGLLEPSTPWSGQRAQDVQGAREHPRGHDVGVGVVVQPGGVLSRVGVVVLVGPHHTVDHVAVRGPVVHGHVGEGPGDLQEELGPEIAQEREVPGGPIVPPDVVGDRQTHVTLEVGVVGEPLPGARVQVCALGLLTAVARALPGEERASEPGGAGGRTGPGQSPPPVAQEAAGDLGQTGVEERQDEQLVPEHVTPVGLAVQTPGGHPHVEVGGVRGQRL